MKTSTPNPHSIATRAFSRWLQCGLVLCLVFPSLRGFDAQFGWWPMWLVALPLACLLLVRPRLVPARTARTRWIAPGPGARQAVRYRRAATPGLARISR